MNVPLSPIELAQVGAAFGSAVPFITQRQISRENPPLATKLNAMPRSPSIDRKSTRLNSSHLVIAYAVFCLKKNNKRALGPLHTPPAWRLPTYTTHSDPH